MAEGFRYLEEVAKVKHHVVTVGGVLSSCVSYYVDS